VLSATGKLRRIGDILIRHGLTHGRTGWYEGDEPAWLPTSGRIPEENTVPVQVGGLAEVADAFEGGWHGNAPDGLRLVYQPLFERWDF